MAMQGHNAVQSALAERTRGVQDVVVLVRKEAGLIGSESQRSHRTVTHARHLLETTVAEHQRACRCGRGSAVACGRLVGSRLLWCACACAFWGGRGGGRGQRVSLVRGFQYTSAALPFALDVEAEVDMPGSMWSVPSVCSTLIVLALCRCC